ncbi:MAG TPA: TonB-dependent receptor, partial [Bryobacteraceae bacterium]
MKFTLIAVLLVLASLALPPTANAQTSSAQITGVLTDSSGAAIVGAKVQITNDLTKLQNEFLTDSGGRYQFQVTPGDYTLHIAQTGFKAYDQKINVVQEERFANPDIRLTVGDVSTTVDVEGEAAHVQTDSSDKTIAVNQTQIEDTPSAGRNFLMILRSLPGTFVANTTDSRGGTAAVGGLGAPTVNGGAGQLLVTINGIASQDSGAPGTGGYQAPSVDAIGEVQVMVSNYTAEYGARNGGQMNVVIKNGTNQYHGTGYYYWRHEELNANEWFNNKNTVTINGIKGQANPKPLYRYQNPGGTVGGPLFIPGKFNRDRNKLFFFFSEDDAFHKGTNGPNHFTMPTALERTGNFSQTVTSTGVQVPIYNPLAGTTSSPVLYSGYIVPPSQISPQGYALLNLFPLPNGLDPSGARAYNYTNSFRASDPVQDRILRIDFPFGKKTSVYVSGLQDYYGTVGVGADHQSPGAVWGQYFAEYGVPNVNLAVNVVHTFRPNLINEFTTGVNRSHQIVNATNTSPCTGNINTIATGTALPYTCSQLSNANLVGPGGQAVTFPNFFPGANLQNLIPNINFGSAGAFAVQSAGQGVTAAPVFGYDSRWPFNGTDQLSSYTDTVTWIKGTHTVKAGFYLEHDARNITIYNLYNTPGSIYFGSDRANSNDTDYPFSNALIGSMQAYGVDNKTQVNHSRYTTYEGFLQDTWKLNRRLTLDVGLRIQSIGQEESLGATLGFFNTASYNPAAVGQLLFPALNSKGQKEAINPKTGAVYPYAEVDTFDPASYPAGSYPWSGAKFYKTSFWNRGMPNLGPRIGFAYDVLGNGKMAIRGGFGIFYGRATSVDQIAAGSGGTGPQEVAPNFLAPAYVYPTFTSLAASTAYYAPQTVYGGTQNILNPQTLQWSFGAQRDIGKGTILDVSYLGWVTHHNYNETGYDLNSVAPYTEWKPTPGPGTNSCGQVTAYLDPTASAANPTTCTGGAFLNSNLVRGMVGYEGWAQIGVGTNAGESNY